MIQGSIRLLSILLLTSGLAFANTNLRAIYFNNRSNAPISVWVVVLNEVEVPGLSQVPQRVLIIPPRATGELTYAYTHHWSSRTRLGLKFCAGSLINCLNAQGEYSQLVMQPEIQSSTRWFVRKASSGILRPYQINDNIQQLVQQEWDRMNDFPFAITFSDGLAVRNKAQQKKLLDTR